MINFYTCNGYKLVHRTSSREDLPAECRAIEEQRKDGYAVIAIEDGTIVADADGYMPANEHHIDCAMLTGMYDR